MKGFDGIPLAEANDKTAENGEQDQTARICSLILPCTLRKSKCLVMSDRIRIVISCYYKSRSYMNSLHTDIILTHYQTTNFRLFQTERVCRRQFQICRKWQKVIQTGRKHCEKRRNCSLRAISPFPAVFSKGLFPRGVKRCHCVRMG